MLTPPTYSDPSQSTDNDLLQMYNSLPPINPSAFGGLPQEAPQGGPQGGPPPPQAQGGPQGQPPMDMNKYLIDKVMEIKRRMTGEGGGVGALTAISNAMMEGQPEDPAIEPMRA